jgi:hypothetical protein
MSMIDLTITLMAVLFVAVSIAMAFVPDRVAEFARRSTAWRRYLRFVSGIEGDDITAERLRIRLQGVIGLFFSIFLCMALWQRLAE